MNLRTPLVVGCAGMLALSGCTSMVRINKEATQQIESKSDAANHHLETLREVPKTKGGVSHLPYVNTKAVVHHKMLPDVFYGHAGLTLRKPLPVSQLARQLERTTGFQVQVAEDLKHRSVNPTQKMAVMESTPRFIGPVAYQGTLQGLFDEIAGKLDATWRFDVGSRTVHLYRYEVRTLSIATVPGTAATNFGLGGSAGQSSVDGGSGQAIRVSSAESKSNYKTELDIWSTLEKNIAPLLSAHGTVSISQPTATITVRERWDKMGQIVRYVDQLNASLTMQVKVHVAVYRVTDNQEDSRGLNWNILYNALSARPSQFGVSLVTPGLQQDGGSLILTSPTETPNGNPAPYAGSQAFIDALSKLGKTSVVQQTTIYTVNNVPAAARLFQSKGYLARTTSLLAGGVSEGNSSVVGAGATLEPGSAETGFTLSILPSVQADGHRLLMQVMLSMSSLDSLLPVESGGQMIQVPTVSGRQFMPRIWLRSGQTLVVAGFQGNTAKRDVATPFSENTWAFGGNRTTGTSKDMLVIVMTPVVTTNNNAL